MSSCLSNGSGEIKTLKFLVVGGGGDEPYNMHKVVLSGKLEKFLLY